MQTPPFHTKVTRQDWVAAALGAIDDVAIDEVRILTLAKQLSISRSSFYWYFSNLEELHDELLSIWEGNTRSIVERASRQAETIIGACLGVFECWADNRLFDARLDLAVRDWGRRDAKIAERVGQADQTRIESISSMFERFGFHRDESTVRARLLYHSQVGYYAVGTDEPIDARRTYLPYYLEGMTGRSPTNTDLAAFEEFLATVDQPEHNEG